MNINQAEEMVWPTVKCVLHKRELLSLDPQKSFLNNAGVRAGEMAQQLRAFPALPGDPTSVPSIHMSGCSQQAVSPVLGSDPCLISSGLLPTCGIQTDTVCVCVYFRTPLHQNSLLQLT